jgi:ABC-type multidrug transport system ATPase subunit
VLRRQKGEPQIRGSGDDGRRDHIVKHGGLFVIVETSAIVARDLGVRRAGRWLLRPASFDIAAGMTGLVGPPGVGKSSLLATFATLRRPHSGVLEVLGRNVEDLGNLRVLRGQISYLPDSFRWASSFKVKDFLAYAAYYKRASNAAVQSILTRLELDDVATMELGVLPPDVRLRAGLAAACVHGPEVVLLDEPLSGLDENVWDELMQLIRGLAPTVLLTAPTADQFTGRCERVYSLVRGRLTELPARADGSDRAPRRLRPRDRRPATLGYLPERVLAGSGARG